MLCPLVLFHETVVLLQVHTMEITTDYFFQSVALATLVLKANPFNLLTDSHSSKLKGSLVEFLVMVWAGTLGTGGRVTQDPS